MSTEPKEILKFLQDNKKITIILLIILVACLTLTYTFKDTTKNDSPLDTSSPPIVTLATTLSTIPKVSPQDPDVIVQQTYTAKVNGQTITVPVVTPSGNSTSEPMGVTGVITQQIDLTPIYTTAKKEAIKEAKATYKKNYEVGIGVGVHDGSYYVPVEIQRNYKADRGISLELHMEPKGITGGAIKWKRLY